jgi:hypothetical protein
MSRRYLVVLALTVAIIAGCGGGTKHHHSDPYTGFKTDPAIMHKWCQDYNQLLDTSGWTDRQIYVQLKDSGQTSGLNYSTYLAQIRWCFSH